ncbi:hypothetical protein Leryth_009365 [Lithospermum erythrorhizon]|nr:hypothetical protein Leryth_009365 [Lithospermum erythrorhizon]
MPTIASARCTSSPKRTLRSNSGGSPLSSLPVDFKVSPISRKSPRQSINDSPSCPAKRNVENSANRVMTPKSPLKKRLLDSFIEKPIQNPIDELSLTDVGQLSVVKEALHVSSCQLNVVCREDEQNKVLEFCKQCVEHEKAGSLYICGCPGTGKSLSMEKVNEALVNWAKEGSFQLPDVLSINCTSLTTTSEIFSKIAEKSWPGKKVHGVSALQLLQSSYSQKPQSDMKMLLIIADELDFLITRDRAVLHDLFMLTTLPFSRCILLGIANSIDLADRFLPKLQSMNCKPMVITFRAYSKDQIIKILRQRLMALPFTVFQPQALELCARRVAAASGDMRKALWVCRSAIEILEAEIKESISKSASSSLEQACSDKQSAVVCDGPTKKWNPIVRADHVAAALSKAFKSPVVDTIQSLPQHQQLILCSAVKLFRGKKKDSTVGELNKFYTDVCKSTLIPPVGTVELSSMCRVLADQGLIKLGQSRDDKLKRVTLQIDEADITFALQGVRFFRNCLQCN